MRRRICRALPALVVLTGASSVAACGQGSSTGSPAVSRVPLARDTRVVAQVRRCDRGANPFCALQLVVVGPHYASSSALQAGEELHLRRAGWGVAHGDAGMESAAESPGDKLRLTYATASADLKSIDQGFIKRAGVIGRGLSAQMFRRSAALSLMLQSGSS